MYSISSSSTAPSSNLSPLLVPIDAENPFYGTDLIVFKDSYAVQRKWFFRQVKRPLLLNGISESEFKRITNLFHAIVDGKKRIRIEEYDPEVDDEVTSYWREVSHPNLNRQNVEDAIKILMTRSIGRQIFYAMEQRGNKSTIKPGKVNRCRKSRNKKTGLHEFTIYLYQEPCKFYSYNSLGQRITTPFILPIVTAHELIHTLDYGDLCFMPQGMQKDHGDYTNEKERKTISGYSSEKAELRGKKFNRLCENTVRDEFNQSRRIDHFMFFYIPNPNNPLKPDLSTPVLRSDYLKRLIQCDVVGDIEKFAKKCGRKYDDSDLFHRYVPCAKGEKDLDGNPVRKKLTPLEYAKLLGSEEMQEEIQKIARTPKRSSRKKGKEVVRD